MSPEPHSIKCCHAGEPFHIWFLPAIGTTLYVGVWFLLWLIDQRGDKLTTRLYFGFAIP